MYSLAGPISDLLEQPIRGNAVNAMVHCPFHEDRTPSFSIHLEEGVWHCFSCGESGTLKSLYRRLGEDVSPDVRLIKAKREAEAPVFKSRNFAAKANGQIRNLRERDDAKRMVRDFTDARGISQDAIAAYGVGWDREREAISFPYADQSRRVTGIKYRSGDGFKFSEPGSEYGFFGGVNVAGQPKVAICEGESDTLSVWSRYADKGITVIGTSGASVSEAQWTRFGLQLLFAERVYLLYDADEPGDKCAEAAMRVLGDDKCVRIRPTKGKDASEHLLSGGTFDKELI
jgi:DNA primase